ncbi:MAG TPA: carbon-nitrogen hydrolase [Phycisphaerales bacterium]|nr:carbon-nitrogen hydrolase [Phycisphaerales bacterium]
MTKVALAQIAPVLLDREKTLARAIDAVREAGAAGAALIAFGEALVPGYPLWVERTDGAIFESPIQKDYFALYCEQAVCIERGDLAPFCAACRDAGLVAVLGVIERPMDRSGHTVYASRVVVDGRSVAGGRAGRVLSVHRKLMPTHEERLVWGIGDGHGLVAHPVGEWTLGALNCWENWMPLARAALYAQGVDLHVAIWPGSDRNTRDITRFIALESRSFVVSVGSITRHGDIPAHLPARERVSRPGDTLCNGGSCVAAPDGSWVLEPVVNTEGVFFAEIDHREVGRARHSFDPTGHYSRPDVLRVLVDRRRLGGAEFVDA